MKDFTSQEWIIVFSYRGEGFFDKFLPKICRYRHIMLFTKRKLGWYMFSPTPRYWLFEELELLSTADLEKHILKIKSCFAWIKIKVNKPRSSLSLVMIPTCVAVVIKMMGIKIGWCFTPWRLCKKIWKHKDNSNYEITAFYCSDDPYKLKVKGKILDEPKWV